MDKTSSVPKAESSLAGRGNREDKARSAGGHKGKDDNKAPQPSPTSGHPHVKGKNDNKAPQPPPTGGHPHVKGKYDNKAPQPSPTSGHPHVKGKNDNKAPQPLPTGGHPHVKGKDDNKAPQPSPTSGHHHVKGKNDNKAPQPSPTSGHPHVKGKNDNKAPQPSSTVDNTKDCAARTKEDPLPSAIKRILEEAMSEAGVKEITVEFLDSQIEHISQQIQCIKDPQKLDANINSLVLKINKSFSERMMPPKSGWKAEVWPRKLPDVGQIRTAAIHLLERVGKSQPSYFAGLLIVAHVLRRFKDIKDHRDECLEVIKEINMLARFVISLKSTFSRSDKGMAGMIQETRQLILHGSILCCTILESSLISKLFKASTTKDQLAKLKGEVVRAYHQLKGELCVETQKDVKYLADRERVRWPRDVQDMMQDLYPSHAVGIDVQLKKVIELLEWKSETKTVAVIVHGIPGMGKTTLADAVFSTIFQQNYTSTNICKYSKIRLCEDKKSSLSTITTLQKTMRDFLVDHDDQRSAHISTFEDGQRQIGNILKKKSVFLCIDNVLNKERLDQLLPLRSTLDEAKKLRLLITARDKGIGTVLGHNMSCKFHEVLPSSSSQAETILKKHMDTQKLDKGLVDDIVLTSGGVPLILSVLGQSIGAEKDKQRAWSIFREELESCSGEFDRLDIAYKHLPDDLKDPFLDICSFYSGWYWEAVEDIMGISILDRLQKRGLLTKDLNYMVTIHDVILRIGLQRSKGSRIMDANEISQLDGKGIKGLWFTTDQGREPIPAKKLGQVARSLRILALQNVKVEGDYNENFPELIYLDAGMNPLPSNVSAFKKLSYLSYSPQKPEDLNLSQMPSKMKRLKLNGKSYSRLFRRCSLDLHGLQNLRVLKLFEFKHLTKLPKEFALLKCLQVLKIADCDGFEEFPTDLGHLNQMANLTIENCPKLRKLPDSISKLTSLRSLKLPHCAGLRELPEDFRSLSSLQILDLKGTGLKMLPSRFAQLSSLRWLYLSSCNKLEYLSNDFHSLPSLQYLTLSSCPKLPGQWMDVIKKVKTIKEVDIRKSEKLLQKWQGITDPPRTLSVKVN